MLQYAIILASQIVQIMFLAKLATWSSPDVSSIFPEIVIYIIAMSSIFSPFDVSFQQGKSLCFSQNTNWRSGVFCFSLAVCWAELLGLTSSFRGQACCVVTRRRSVVEILEHSPCFSPKNPQKPWNHLIFGSSWLPSQSIVRPLWHPTWSCNYPHGLLGEHVMTPRSDKS